MKKRAGICNILLVLGVVFFTLACRPPWEKDTDGTYNGKYDGTYRGTYTLINDGIKQRSWEIKIVNGDVTSGYVQSFYDDNKKFPVTTGTVLNSGRIDFSARRQSKNRNNKFDFGGYISKDRYVKYIIRGSWKFFDNKQQNGLGSFVGSLK